MPLPEGSPAARPSARQAAYEQLREWILSGQLEPGEPIRDLEVAAALAVSRTPVREALIELARDGLVELQRGRTTLVAEPRLDRAPDLFATGGALDALAARTAASLISEDDLDRMRGLLQESEAVEEPAKLRELDEAFHGVYYQAAGNALVVEYMQRINLELRRLERRAFGEPDIRAGAHHEHERILQALRDRDPEEAHQAAWANWSQSWDRIADRFAEAAGQLNAQPQRRSLVPRVTAPAS